MLGGPGTFDERLDQVDALGVDVVRVNLRWDEIAAKRPAKPSSHLDPAYRWAAGDVLLGGLRARGIAPVVTLVGTPRWANGGRAANWAPKSPSSFANFAYAAAKRYPYVRRWVIWNEPNKYWQLRPTSASTYVRAVAQPGLRRAQAGEPREPRRRRRDRPARWLGQRLAGRLDPRHGPRARAA